MRRVVVAIPGLRICQVEGRSLPLMARGNDRRVEFAMAANSLKTVVGISMPVSEVERRSPLRQAVTNVILGPLRNELSRTLQLYDVLPFIQSIAREV